MFIVCASFDIFFCPAIGLSVFFFLLSRQANAVHLFLLILSSGCVSNRGICNTFFFFKVREELIASIRDAEDGLLHLKRSRLLRVVDEIAFGQGSESLFEDPKSEPSDPTEDAIRPRESEIFSVGSKCRFRYSDGRWYNGYLVGLEGPSSARISFLNPTSEKMLVRASFCRSSFLHFFFLTFSMNAIVLSTLMGYFSTLTFMLH